MVEAERPASEQAVIDVLKRGVESKHGLEESKHDAVERKHDHAERKHAANNVTAWVTCSIRLAASHVCLLRYDRQL